MLVVLEDIKNEKDVFLEIYDLNSQNDCRL